ncbi:MAG: ABC transporter substrate-binding protein [Acidimicrobiia bacterium]|nr:ABC transporter substrate-binding protein [Acidimicrobiia bacterium]
MARWKRILALGLVAGLALVSCGGGDDDGAGGDGGNGGNGGNGEANGGAPELPPCPLGAIDEAGATPVEITMWHSMAEENLTTLEALAARFNESQGDVVVSLLQQPSYDETLTKFKAGLGGGDLPDLIQLEDTATQLMVDSGAALPAQSCVDDEGYDLSDHLTRVIDYYSVQGVLWPMPFNVSNPVLYFNKKMFTQVGLDPENPPSTLDELREASQTVVDAGAAPVGLAFKQDPWYLEQWMAMAGEPYVNNGNGRDERATEVVFENEVGLEIFTWLSSMVADGLAQPASRTGFDNVLALGNLGAAMTMDTSAVLGTAVQVLEAGGFPEVGLEGLGVAPLPGPEGDGGTFVAGGSLFILDTGTPAEQEAAWRFAKFLNEPESQAEWAAGTGYIPITRSAAELPQVQELWERIPGFKVAYDQLSTGPNNVATAGPLIGDFSNQRRVVVEAMQSMFTQGTPPDQALAAAAQGSNEVVQEYNSRLG